MILILNSYYFLKQHQPVDLCNGEVLCSLWGTDWILKYCLDELRFQRVNVLGPLKRANPGTRISDMVLFLLQSVLSPFLQIRTTINSFLIPNKLELKFCNFVCHCPWGLINCYRNNQQPFTQLIFINKIKLCHNKISVKISAGFSRYFNRYFIMTLLNF
jgi:hypothetical protein